MDSWIIAPGGAVVLAIFILTRMIIALNRTVNDHAERIAHLEGEIHAREGQTED